MTPPETRDEQADRKVAILPQQDHHHAFPDEVSDTDSHPSQTFAVVVSTEDSPDMSTQYEEARKRMLEVLQEKREETRLLGEEHLRELDSIKAAQMKQRRNSRMDYDEEWQLKQLRNMAEKMAEHEEMLEYEEQQKFLEEERLKTVRIERRHAAEQERERKRLKRAAERERANRIRVDEEEDHRRKLEAIRSVGQAAIAGRRSRVTGMEMSMEQLQRRLEALENRQQQLEEKFTLQEAMLSNTSEDEDK